jgi:hypothetical protein
VVTSDPDSGSRAGSLSRPEILLFGLPSLALGVLPLVWPGRAARLIGVDDSPTARVLLRTLGARELVVAALFLRRGTAPWLWGFVAQDATDLPLCTVLLLRRRQADHRRFSIAYGTYLAVAAIDTYAALTRTLGRHAGSEGVVHVPSPATERSIVSGSVETRSMVAR